MSLWCRTDIRSKLSSACTLLLSLYIVIGLCYFALVYQKPRHIRKNNLMLYNFFVMQIKIFFVCRLTYQSLVENILISQKKKSTHFYYCCIVAVLLYNNSYYSFLQILVKLIIIFVMVNGKICFFFHILLCQNIDK